MSSSLQSGLAEAATGSAPALLLLLAPSGALSGDGQLRELMLERRAAAIGGRGQGDLWFLPAELCSRRLGCEGKEGLVLRDRGTALWLQLRFGGELEPLQLSGDGLDQEADALPPAAPEAALGLGARAALGA